MTLISFGIKKKTFIPWVIMIIDKCKKGYLLMDHTTLTVDQSGSHDLFFAL